MYEYLYIYAVTCCTCHFLRFKYGRYRTTVYYCILLYTTVYYCILLYTTVICILLYTTVYYCILLYACTY